MSDNDLPSEEKDKISKSNVVSTQDAPPEVFDSSTYNSMIDLETSATMSESETKKVLSDTEYKESIEPEVVHTESTRNPKTSSTVPPTMEGRASALKKLKQSQSQSMPKQLDKQTIQINKNITQMLQPLQKHVKSVEKQSALIKQIQSQLRQLQKQVSQIQRAVNIGKKKRK
jgi:NurA-like 5'-3' nuclease